MPRLPNFFVVGAAKSGTTSLGQYLAEHPQIYMSPIKEPSYFACDAIADFPLIGWSKNQRGLEKSLDGPMQDRRGGCVLDWEQYLKLFRNVSQEIAIGEASTAYLISARAPGEIRESIPEARIIIMLRSPVERAFSTYLMFCRNGRLRASFSDVIRSDGTTEMAEWRRMTLETRKIAKGVERFINVFPSAQIRWYFYEDFSQDTLGTMRSIYRFLGVDPQFNPNVRRRYNEGSLPRGPRLHRALHATNLWSLANRLVPQSARPLVRRVLFHTSVKPRISALDRSCLIDYFRDDVTELEHLVGRDLSHWLRPE